MSSPRPTAALRFVLGDQLSPALSALRGADPAHDVILMTEVGEETTYVPHHKKKIAFILAAMRAFRRELEEKGFRVRYVALDDPDNTHSFTGELERAIAALKLERVIATLAGEHRVIAMQRSWADDFNIDVDIRDDDRFLCTHAEFARWAEGRKSLRMEYFYREMRQRTGLLMDGDQPEGGQWNYDKDNRKPAEPDLFMPRPQRFEPDAETKKVLALVNKRCASAFGDLEPFWFGVTRAQAEKARDHFLKHALPHFGDFQDAMLVGERFLYHSVLSLYLNVGLLEPLDLCRRAEREYKRGCAPLNAVEGFIRQIIGWREYVRGIYFREGESYISRNALGADRDLPEFYWTGETDMACVRACVTQTREEAYAHHIQRLMVTGNFALLAGIEPRQVHEWYLAVYADAFEWVEAPNTIGMALFADDGLLASKPYAASGAYIDRMSDYCRGCAYDVKAKEGERACPFNLLYWDFIARHERRFANNPRMAVIVKAWAKMDPGRRNRIRKEAKAYLDGLKPGSWRSP
ncbi:MAG: cryptochrome/photolyase family protein [Alphaproteobacteria bacterium]|nr:cryptochrome/photolyase family protein [Alphaproteobacteria bacterium]